MKQTVTVLKTDGEKITAGCDKSACEGCKNSIFCRKTDNIFEVLNEKGEEVEAGDKIIIDLPTGKSLFSTFMSLVLPLLCFFAGLFASYVLGYSEIMQFVFALAALAIGFLISFLYFKLTKKSYFPTLESKESK